MPDTTAPATDRDAIQQTLKALTDAGHTLHHVVDERGADPIYVTTHQEALDAITAVDEAWIYVLMRDASAYGWVFFVLGNEPFEVVNDYTVSLDHALEPLFDGWDAALS